MERPVFEDVEPNPAVTGVKVRAEAVRVGAVVHRNETKGGFTKDAQVQMGTGPPSQKIEQNFMAKIFRNQSNHPYQLTLSVATIRLAIKEMI